MDVKVSSRQMTPEPFGDLLTITGSTDIGPVAIKFASKVEMIETAQAILEALKKNHDMVGFNVGQKHQEFVGSFEDVGPKNDVIPFEVSKPKAKPMKTTAKKKTETKKKGSK